MNEEGNSVSSSSGDEFDDATSYESDPVAATPLQRGETTSLLGAPQPDTDSGGRQRTKALLEQLSAVNQTLANQTSVYRTENRPWSAAQAAVQATTRFTASVSPRGISLDAAGAASAPAPEPEPDAEPSLADPAPVPPAPASIPEARSEPTGSIHRPSTLHSHRTVAEGHPGRSRRESNALGTTTHVARSNVTLKLYAVVEQAENLPIMDLLSSDPYVKVWHQESTPPQQPDSHADVTPDAQKLPCVPSSNDVPPVEFKATSLTHLGQSPYVRENLDPIWRFRVEHEITLRPDQLLDKGWLVVEVWDYDRVGNDDPMGRIDIALEECEEDMVISKWYKLGWVPGQTHPGPGERSRIKVNLLLSSVPNGLPQKHEWMINSYDFVELQEIITEHQYTAQQQDEEPEDRAVISRCEWHLYEIVNEAFATFDVDGDGIIQPAELMHVMNVLGEELDNQEIAGMIAECKAWGQSREGRKENDQSAQSSADSQHKVFAPVSVGDLDFTKDKSGKSKACITAEEFRNMLTEYWVARKYGSKSYGAANDFKFRRIDKRGLKDRAEASPAAKCVGLESALDDASLQAMPPVPGWMADIAAGHNRMPDDRRVPEMFWFFLRRKMEQVLLRANKTGVKEVGFFRKDVKALQDKSSLGYTVRNTESRFSVCWDFMQVVLLSYVSVSVPYQTGFSLSSETGSGLWWWEFFVDLYFVVDIILNFRTPFYDAQGRLVYSSKEMAMHYLKGWLLIDIGSCASLLQYIFLLTDTGDSEGASKARLTKVLRLLRLAKLLRLARAKRLLDRLGDELIAILAPLGNVFLLLVGTLMCMHLISCFWYLAGSSSDIVNGEENTGWVEEVFEDPENVTIGTRYLTSLYGIMLGEFTLKPTDAEKSFALVSVVVNGFIYGSVAATLSSIMVMLKAPHAEYNAKMDVLKTWMRAKRLPFPIREQVQVFYEAKLSGSERKVVDQTVIIADLQPAPIATELVQILYAEIIERVPIFSQLDPEVIVKLCMLLQPIPALSGCPVVIQGRQATEMYVVLRGRLQVWEQTDKALTRVRCTTHGIQFWSTVFMGLDTDEKNVQSNAIEHQDMSDQEDQQRMMQARNRNRRSGLSLDNPTVRAIQDLQRDASVLASEGRKKMQANDFSCILVFQKALQMIDVALAKIGQPGGQASGRDETLVATQLETVKLQKQLNTMLRQAVRAKASFSELRKVDQTEREKNPTGAIDLRGRENDPALAHRVLTMGNKSVVQGVVRVENPTMYNDFDPALGVLVKPPKCQMHQTVDALEVRQGNVLGYLAEGDYFGETSLVNRRKSQYDRNVTAVVDSELAYLSKSDVLELADEFPELKRQIMSFSSLRRSLEEPRRQFNALDEDSSGHLDRDELRQLLLGLAFRANQNQETDDEQVEERQIEEAIHEMDWSGDGEVSFEEFEAWWIRRQQRVASGADASTESASGYSVRGEEARDGGADDDSNQLGVDCTEDDEELDQLGRKTASRIQAEIKAVERRLDKKLEGVNERLDEVTQLLLSLKAERSAGEV